MKWLKRYMGDNFWEAKFFQPQYNLSIQFYISLPVSPLQLPTSYTGRDVFQYKIFLISIYYNFCWPKTIRSPVVSQDQHRIALWGLKPWWAMCKSPAKMQRTPLQRGKGSWEGLELTKSPQIFTGWVLTALGALAKKRRGSRLLTYWARPIVTGPENPHSGLPTLFNWSCCLLTFYHPFMVIFEMLKFSIVLSTFINIWYEK